ncbi:MAG: hypothetical protein AB9869_33375 [Verrucomicrobiia bacterium]
MLVRPYALGLAVHSHAGIGTDDGIRRNQRPRQYGNPTHHSDPFDRWFAGQALVEGVPGFSPDAIFAASSDPAESVIPDST